MLFDTDAAVLGLDNADPFDLTTPTNNDKRILILTELDRVLLRLSPWTENDYIMVRPGVQELVATLLQDSARELCTSHALILVE